jgi:hypothetical protein
LVIHRAFAQANRMARFWLEAIPLKEVATWRISRSA